MSTSITMDMITANLTKRGVKWRYYKNRADALVHNRNGASNNANATPGGWGPIRGLFIHNFASDISDESSLAYLYRGDSTRELPGPLSQFGLEDDGEWVIVGWGAANHASAGDSKVEAIARSDRMPLDRDLVPNAANTKTLIAPFYLGVEMLYGKAPSAAQRSSLIKGGAAIMEVLGYTGGSVVMHRETHNTRSDPVGFKGFEIRRAIDEQLNNWEFPTPPTTQDWFDMATKEDLKAAIREVFAEESFQQQLAETVWTGQRVVYDVREIDDPSADTPRVTASTLLEEIMRSVRLEAPPITSSDLQG